MAKKHQPMGVRAAAKPAAQPDVQGLLQQAVAMHRGGQLPSAEWLYQQVLQLQPAHPGALQMLGVLKFQSGKAAEGIELLRRVVALDPQQAGAHNNLGNALRETGQYAAAIESFDRALALDPGLADAYSNRGNAQQELKQYPAALASYERAIALQPGHAHAFHNRGMTLLSLHRHAEAEASFDTAIALQPGFADAYVHRASARWRQEKLAPALQDCDSALALNPGLLLAHRGRAFVLNKMQRFQATAEACARILALAPADPDALGNRLSALQYACDWTDPSALVPALLDADLPPPTVLPPTVFMLFPAARQLAFARTWTQRHASAAVKRLWNGERYGHDRIRLAYLSADLHNHATAYLAAELFELHDRERFECTAYSFGPDPADGMRSRLRDAFEHFIEVPTLSDLQIAQLVREHEIDIAIDLKGFTVGGRPGILAHRPAPIQVNYLGYPGTLGADTIDYIVGDASVTPPGHDGFFAERPVRMPGSYQVNDRRRAIAVDGPGRADCGLPSTGLVFCCFNNSYKITPEVFGIWMRLLQQVPGSVLWLLDDNDDAVANLRREAVLRGIAGQRLVFAPRADLPAHLARHRLADLFLDTLPCNAHTTASDALWAGLPVLTCVGEGFAGRVAASLVRAAGLPELAVASWAEYEALALVLAMQPDRLQALRARLIGGRDTCSLFDTDRFRRHLESAYTTMHERHLRGLPPEAFSVPD